jgi:hypothetical protein
MFSTSTSTWRLAAFPPSTDVLTNLQSASGKVFSAAPFVAQRRESRDGRGSSRSRRNLRGQVEPEIRFPNLRETSRSPPPVASRKSLAQRRRVSIRRLEINRPHRPSSPPVRVGTFGLGLPQSQQQSSNETPVARSILKKPSKGKQVGRAEETLPWQRNLIPPGLVSKARYSPIATHFTYETSPRRIFSIGPSTRKIKVKKVVKRIKPSAGHSIAADEE